MNKAAQDFFDNLPSEDEEKGQNFDMFNEAEPEKDKKEEAPADYETQEQEEEGKEPSKEERKKPLRSERRAEKQTNYALEQLQQEREARIRLEEQVKMLATQKKVEADPDIKRLLTEANDPEEATAIFQSLMDKAAEKARQEAREEWKKAQSEGDQEVAKMASVIQERLESIEDQFGVDLTDDKDTRNKFLDFVNELADPDSDALPNMNRAWQLFQKQQIAGPSQTERKAAISSRGMTRSVKPIPEGKNLTPMTFDSINRGSWWDKIRGA